tara:strand:- start:1492 stop:3381 length:1890 start_codon:yes stop_codon:yes gene_type:complete
MNFITLDFETFYSKEFSLSKMTTEQYIRSPQFQTIGVGVKVNEGVTEWASGTHEQIKEYLDSFEWDKSMVIGQNTMFDGAILSWLYDIHPKALADTMGMSKAMDGVHISASLKAQAERHLDERKGTEIVNAFGKRLEDFSDDELARYGDYCIQDVELTYALFKHYMAKGFPARELKVIDVTLRMYTEPKLVLDAPALVSHLKEVKLRKQELLDEVKLDRKELMSNALFAIQLEKLEVTPPRKISKTTNKETYAFAKTDMEFQALQEHPDDRVQALVAARLGNKSTLEETRTQRFIGIAERGPLPGPVSYYGAHTGRWSGTDKINLQNLPSRGTNGKKLKKTIGAPEGYLLIEADLSQIEARMVAWLAGQDDLVAAFAKGEDVYKIMAAKIYGISIEAVTGQQRFIGKGVILGCGYGMGAKRFKEQIGGMGVEITEQESLRIVQTYRSTYTSIKKLWYRANDCIVGMHGNRNIPYGITGIMRPDAINNRIYMPNNLSLIYPELHITETTQRGSQFAYKGRKGIERFYGGLLTENTCQALAKLIIAEHMLLINRKYHVTLTVHDSVIALVPEAEVEEAAKYIYKCMKFVPEWATGLPLDSELGYAKTYGNCDDNVDEVTAMCAAAYNEEIA